MTAKERCRAYRKRILEISQTVPALHIGGAFSAVEIVDGIYNELMEPKDTFVLSKGHAAILQYVVLESLGVLNVSGYSTGELCVHPVLKTPGIAATTGALGHGLTMALGMAMASKGTIYTLLSDGELQEGSTWEALLLASSRKVGNLVAFVDNNDFQSATRASDTHPTLYPIDDKFRAFGWEVVDIDGHNTTAIKAAMLFREPGVPLAVIAKTTKGRGVSYMENVPMWHYRSPNAEEYAQAMMEIA